MARHVDGRGVATSGVRGMNQKRLTPQEQIQKRIDVLSRLLDNPEPMYPVACHCSTKSRLSTSHGEECPYRLMREILRDLQRAVPQKDPS